MSHLVVRHPDQTEQPIIDLSALLVAFVAINQSQINHMRRGSITVHFDGLKIKPELHEYWDSMSSAA